MPDKTQVTAMDPGQKNSPITALDAEPATLVMAPGANACFWNGAEFAEGALVETEGVTFECTFGCWIQSD